MYPERDREVTVVETTTELERQVSRARQAVQQYTSGVLASVRSGVSSVIPVSYTHLTLPTKA